MLQDVNLVNLTSATGNNQHASSEFSAESFVDVASSDSLSWFRKDSIHQIEKREFAEFFDGRSPSKTPTAFLEYRNFMIQTYEQNPNQYLTQTACRRNLAGDVCAILRIHSFLEHWGLINYRVNADFFPVPAPVPSSLYTPAKLLQYFIKNDSSNASQNTSQLLRKNIFSGKVRVVICKSCSADCSSSYYLATTKRPDYFVCPTCFSNGKYDPSVSSTDFSKFENEFADISSSWTDVETLRLLEAIQRHSDNWDKIAEEVGTKTKAECVMHFVRLPIEEEFLDRKPTTPTTTSSSSSSFADDSPFSDSTNPVMALVAFLSNTITPSVAAAAAKAGLEKFEQIADEKRKTTNGSSSATCDGPSINSGISQDDLRAASAAALAGAAAKAQVLAAKEERQIEKLIRDTIFLQLQKVELKLKNFEMMETALDAKRAEVEKKLLSLSPSFSSTLVERNPSSLVTAPGMGSSFAPTNSATPSM